MKNEHSTSTTTFGLSFSSLLTIVFIALKLCGLITWSWLWVLSPLWIPFVIVITIFFVWVLICKIIIKGFGQN